MDNWFVAYVDSGVHYPEDVHMHFAQRFVQPLITAKRYNRRYRRLMSFKVPLLPGYAFVHTDDPQRFAMQNSFVRGWVRNDSRELVRATDEDVLRMVELANSVMENVRYSYDMALVKQGDEVVLKEDGFLSDTVSRVTAITDKGEVCVQIGEGQFAITRTVHPSVLKRA